MKIKDNARQLWIGFSHFCYELILIVQHRCFKCKKKIGKKETYFSTMDGSLYCAKCTGYVATVNVFAKWKDSEDDEY